MEYPLYIAVVIRGTVNLHGNASTLPLVIARLRAFLPALNRALALGALSLEHICGLIATLPPCCPAGRTGLTTESRRLVAL